MKEKERDAEYKNTRNAAPKTLVDRFIVERATSSTYNERMVDI